MSELTLQSSKSGNVIIIKTSGYINNTGGELIAQECYKYIDEGFARFVFNLKDSKVVNSVGISILIEIMEKLEEVEGKIIFTNLDPAVEKTFTIMGLFQFSAKAADDDEAQKMLD